MRRSRPQVAAQDRREQQEAPPSPQTNLLSVLDEAEKIYQEEYEVDNILSQIPPTVPTSDVGSHIDRLPPERSTPLGFLMGPMSAEVEARLIADVYGRKPPEDELMEDRLDSLEREIGRLGRAERSSLDKALRRHPLLTIASPHVRAMIREDDYDAPSAARRLARYWRQREGVFGSRAFSKGILTQPEFDDYTRHYRRCIRAMDDPELDREMRDMAREYVHAVNRIKIEAMDKLIENSPEKDKEALMEAVRANPEMVQSAEHKLLFLKCEDFIEARAAVRMMKYWAMKKLLFGTDRLGQEITLADVESSVFESNVVGHSLLVPGTDEAGRSVFWGNARELLNGEGWTVEGVVQFMWCILHIALDRPSCQENGLVAMINVHGMNAAATDRTSAVRKLCSSLFLQCMPIRVCVVHLFFAPSSWWQSFMMGFVSKWSNVFYMKWVMHIGTFEENRRVLQDQFGIGPDQVVDDLGGNVDMEEWRCWIRERREEER